MVSIERADKKDAQLLSEIAASTFIESHGNSAKPEDIDKFIAEKYSLETLSAELTNKKNNYHFIYFKNRLAGFSNIIFNFTYENSEIENIAKLERIYLLKEFYDYKLGQQLFDFNINLAKQNNQQGVWLFVWKENERAIQFYIKNGFRVIGSFDYKISETHTNPNHLMFLAL